MHQTNNLLKNLAKQRQFFASGATYSISWRLDQLKKLNAAIKKFEPEMLAALKQDLGRPEVEGLLGDVAPLEKELHYFIQHLPRLAADQSVSSPLFFVPARSFIKPKPLGQVLNIAPWNYPIQLSLLPAIGALAAGNVVVIKPSELAPASADVLSKLASECFPQEVMQVHVGGREVTEELLQHRFDHIFFTGSTEVGKIIYKKASETLTPVTLELGGKSPCLVDASAAIEVSARRLAWGKFFNAGQTCVSPDYLLLDKKISSRFIEEIIRQIKAMHPDKNYPDFARIVSERHFDRLSQLLKQSEVIYGGEQDRTQKLLSPTLVKVKGFDEPLMKEEIFGPILPIIEYESLEDAKSIIAKNPNPLAFYIFSTDQKQIDHLLEQVACGGCTVNDTLIHLGNHNLPFGGRGFSGMGGYHGEYSFRTFSHQQSVLKKSIHLDSSLRYPPYKNKFQWLKTVLRWS